MPLFLACCFSKSMLFYTVIVGFPFYVLVEGKSNSALVSLVSARFYNSLRQPDILFIKEGAIRRLLLRFSGYYPKALLPLDRYLQLGKCDGGKLYKTVLLLALLFLS